MPLFEVGPDQLVPFRRVQAGPDLYEREIEELLWRNLDAFVGRPLFPVARQAQLGGGLIADVVAMDRIGRVHVIEVKRDVDRRQLAQCLEYAGWARNTNLDEIAGLFHDGADEFFAAWTEFTGTTAPLRIERPPQLVLVARDFDERTHSALAYLTENSLPVTVLRVTLYEDGDHRRFVDVDADHEPEIPFSDVAGEPAVAKAGRARFEIDGRRVQMSDLLDAGLLHAGDALTWDRTRIGQAYSAVVTDAGSIVLADGRTFASPSRAAAEAAEVPAYDGWYAWRTRGGQRLGDLRERLLAGDHVDSTNWSTSDADGQLPDDGERPS